MSEETSKRFCVAIPAYNEAEHVAAVVQGARKFCGAVVVVDDGSRDDTASAAERAGARVIRHGANMGKGTALSTGLKYALEQGFEFAVTMDSDGQHSPDDIESFLAVYRETGAAAIIGNRMADSAAMPFVRRMTNRYMSWLLSRDMKQRVPDTQCGFRLFKRDIIPILLEAEAPRFSAESEVLLRLAEHGVRVLSAPIRVIYRDERSKIRPIRDTLRFFRMLSKLRRELKRAARARGKA